MAKVCSHIFGSFIKNMGWWVIGECALYESASGSKYSGDKWNGEAIPGAARL